MIPFSQDNILIFSSYKRAGLGCPDFFFIYTIICLQLFVNFWSTVGSGRAEKKLTVILDFQGLRTGPGIDGVGAWDSVHANRHPSQPSTPSVNFIRTVNGPFPRKQPGSLKTQ